MYAGVKILTSFKAGGLEWETLYMRKQNPMQKLMIWILIIMKRHLAEVPSLLFILSFRNNP